MIYRIVDMRNAWTRGNEINHTGGGRSESSQKVLRQARHTCLSELKREAAKIGANGVIAIEMNYSEFSGEGKSMLFLVATGTAVLVERIGRA